MIAASTEKTDYDVLVIGGGPTGATAALVLARAGLSVAVLERAKFPRFHVGESFLPKNFELIRKLGLESELRKLKHVPKFGAEFGFGYSLDTTTFSFDIGLDGSENEAFNMERAGFDDMMLREARKAGAQVVEGATVKRATKLSDGDVAVDTSNGTLTGRYLFDASGQATLLGKQLDTRRGFPNHRKVAYFGHYENVKRREGRVGGYPTIAMCDEGWFWMIPIDERRTSIGLVVDADTARQVNVPAHEMLAWGVERCPLVFDRTKSAVPPERNHVIADFSYRCDPCAGPGYFLLGDSAVFYDPIFSSGICLGMVGASEAAESVVQILQGTLKPGAARKRYSQTVRNSSNVFFRLVNSYYEHSFRELFLEGQGPLQVHRAVISVLAGHVFPKPSFALRWRLKAFEWMVRLNKRFALVPRRDRFSLLESEPLVKPALESVLSAAS